MSGFYEWLKEVRCTTVREAAERLGIQVESSRDRLRRLERRGVLEKKFFNGVAVYCVKEGAQLPPPLTRGPRAETRIRMEQVVDVLTREGCVSSSALCKRLGLGHTAVRHIMLTLLSQGRAVEVVVGKTAIWCRDRETAEELVSRLRAAAHRLASYRRYVRPSELLQMVRRDRETYELFARFVKLSRFDSDYIGPVALAFADSILRSLYGDPIRQANHKHVYFVAPQPRQDLSGIAIRDGAEKALVHITLPSDLAEALKGTNVEEVVVQALQQLLERHR
jgi:predicted ArsR family transcriptional regulator